MQFSRSKQRQLECLFITIAIFYRAESLQIKWIISDIIAKNLMKTNVKTDLSFSTLGQPSPTESTEHNESCSMLPLNSRSFRFEIMDFMADAKFSLSVSESPSPERLQGQRTVGEKSHTHSLATHLYLFKYLINQSHGNNTVHLDIQKWSR